VADAVEARDEMIGIAFVEDKDAELILSSRGRRRGVEIAAGACSGW